jgi:hypothetical protein
MAQKCTKRVNNFFSKGVRGQATGFTTVGKPKMAQKQYNSPMQMYSEEAIDEIMREGTLK